jgi:hypothetical protein
MTQQGLFTQAISIPVHRSIHEAERPRLSRQCIEIHERLKLGPATNADLSQIAQRFSARLGELKAAGIRWSIVHRDRDRGVNTYALETA